MDNKKLEQIKNIAETAHKLVFGSNTDYEHLEKYLEDFGVKIFYAELSDVDGYLRFENGMPRIVVKAHQFQPRQRFTMAHEFGHLLLHHKWLPGEYVNKDKVQEVTMYRGSTYDTVDESEREIQANNFAGNFLMPEYKIIELLRKQKENLGKKLTIEEAIKLISKGFKVSEPAAKVRLERLVKRA